VDQFWTVTRRHKAARSFRSCCSILFLYGVGRAIASDIHLAASFMARAVQTHYDLV
jgi:hypothetical protein